MVPKKTHWTLQEVAERWNCSYETVLQHVHTGTLGAIDISTPHSRRSRYAVPLEALEEFERTRATPPPEPTDQKPRTVHVRPGDLIQIVPLNG